MFNLDRWLEIFDTLLRHKLRTALTALSVAWGILMLVILLGAGTGLQKRVEYNFRDDAVNSIWMSPGRTSKPFEGHAIGRDIRFTNEDYDYIKNHIDGVEYITGRYNLWNNLVVTYGTKKSSFDVRSSHPDHKYLENTIMLRGRFLNDLDLEERRKVAAIGLPVAKFLFGDEEPMGKWIHINGIAYQVVGMFEDSGGEGEMRKIYVPIATAQMAYGAGERIHQLMFTVGNASVDESKRIENEVRDLLAKRHHFSPDDKRALRLRNNVENFREVSTIFDGIRLFVWIVGFMTIVAGIVGVSNIMLIAVKERTREIGIRKAMGATPGEIVGQIVQEAVFITAVAGYMGLLAGVVLLELVSRYVPENDFIRDPQVDMRVAVSATVLLVLAGALAGFFPAWRAARVDPVVALRDE
ncbi:MAG: ABC transporter permease [Proteobacteria bacterium]|nr:ABC transporter permease [Pseudomonadota bacterium]